MKITISIVFFTLIGWRGIVEGRYPVTSWYTTSYSIDGKGNHPLDNDRNGAGTIFQPVQTFYPYDGSGNNITIDELPNPRNISTVLFSKGPLKFNSFDIAAISAAWGQFIAHDLIQTAAKSAGNNHQVNNNHSVNVPVPVCDSTFDNQCTGTQTITVKRNNFHPLTGTSGSNPRRQLNEQTGWLDASTVYSTSPTRMAELRSFVMGLLIEDSVNGMPNACLRSSAPVPMAHPNHGDPCILRMAGDIRANVAPGIVSLHGLFVLEHNRIARNLANKNPSWSDEILFYEARRRVIAIIQAITYNEYVIELLNGPLPSYTGYNASMDARIDPNFAIAAYRYGHSGINTLYLCVTKEGEMCKHGNLILRDVYFQPNLYLEGTDPVTIADILRGLVVSPESNIDTAMVDDVRNHLEGIRADLAVADIVRGRDFGLPSFCMARVLYGVPLPCNNISDITKDPAIANILSSLYNNNASLVELWVGGLAEAGDSGSFIGPTFRAIIRDQFIRLRDGDWWYYENSLANITIDGKTIPAFTAEERTTIRQTRLKDVIARNTDWTAPPMSIFRTTTYSSIASAAVSGSGSGSGTTNNVPPPVNNGNTNTNTNTVRRVTINSVISLEWTPPSTGSTSLTLTLKFSGNVGSSWVGMGWGGSMVGADIWMMRATGPSTGQVVDTYSPSYNMPLSDSSQDVSLVSVSTANGVTSFTLRRDLNTGDTNDKPITTGNNAVIFAWSTSTATYGYHGGDRIAGSIDFLRPLASSSNGTGTSDDSLSDLGFAGGLDSALSARIATYGFHGLTMFFVWGFLIPLSVVGVYFFRHKAAAQAFHKWANLVSTSLTLPAAGTALVGFGSGTTRSVAHAFIGLSISSLMIAQIIMGAMVRGWMQGDKQPPHYWFLIKRIHKWLGYSMVIGALINCIIGAGLLLGDTAQWVVIGYFVTMIILILFAAFREEKYRDKSQSFGIKTLDQDTNRRYSMSHSSASMTMAEVRAHVRGGSKWVIVSGYIYDVGGFIINHPGGAYLIERHIGSDVTQFFRGQDRFDHIIPAHKHSQRALDLLRTLCVGALRQADAAVSWADAPSLPDESCTDVWRLVARTVLPGEARRAVVKLEFDNIAADPSNARSWIPSSFGRYMVVRIPKHSLETFLKLENDMMQNKAYYANDPFTLAMDTYNGNSSHNLKALRSSSLFSSNKLLTNVRTGMFAGPSNQIYPNLPPLDIPHYPSSSFSPANRQNTVRDDSGSVSYYTPGSVTGNGNDEAMLWSRGRSQQQQSQQRSLPSTDTTKPKNTYYRNNERSPSNDWDTSPTNYPGSPFSDTNNHYASNRLHPGNLSVHLSTTASSDALNGGMKAVASGAVVERPYTIVRADGKRGLIMYIRRYPEGSVSRWMYGLPIGAEVVMTGPKGLGLHLDDSQGGVIVGIYQGTCIVAAFDLVQHIAAIAEEKRKQYGIRDTRQPLWSREQWEAANRTQHMNQGSTVDTVPSSTPGTDTPDSSLENKSENEKVTNSNNPQPLVLIPQFNGESTDDNSGTNEEEEKNHHGEKITSTTTTTSLVEPKESSEAYKTLFPPKENKKLLSPSSVNKNQAILIGNVSTTLAGGSRRLGIIDTTEGSTNTKTNPGKKNVRLPPLQVTSPPIPEYNYSTEDNLRYRTISDDGIYHESTAINPDRYVNNPNSRVLVQGGRRLSQDTFERTPPRFKLVLMVVFEHEDAIIEREWLQHMDATCDDFELHINLSHIRDKRKVHDMGLVRLTTGRLTASRLERLLPPKNLLTVSLCGTPKFQKDIRDIYESLGLPKGLLSVVA